MIVDDHLVIRIAIKAGLEKHHYRIIGESDNGLDTISLVRTLNPDVKIIIFTAQSSENYAVRTIQAGAHSFVSKQDDIEDLVMQFKLLQKVTVTFPISLCIKSS